MGTKLQGLNRWFGKGETDALQSAYGGRAAAYCTADQTKASSVSMSNVTDLYVPVSGNTIYRVQAWLYLTIANAAHGINIDFDASTCTANALAFSGTYVDTGGTILPSIVTALATDFDGSTSTAWDLFLVDGTIDVATPGVLQLRFCQSSSGASNTVIKKGSYLTVSPAVLS